MMQASLGLDAPVEVVNLKEVEDMAKVVSGRAAARSSSSGAAGWWMMHGAGSTRAA